jgi:hypothetical protein
MICSQEIKLWNVEVVLLVFLLWKVCKFTRVYEDVHCFSHNIGDMFGGFQCCDILMASYTVILLNS